jgi:hypothetical protein
LALTETTSTRQPCSAAYFRTCGTGLRRTARLVPAGAGADFQHGRAAVGGVARQHGDGQAMFGLGQVGRQPRHLLLGQRAHVGVRLVECRQAGELAAHRADGSGGPRHRLQLGIVTAGGDELRAFQRPRSQPRLQLREPRADLGKAGIGDAHAARLAITVATNVIGLDPGSVPADHANAIEIPGQARGDEDMIFQQLHHSAVVGKSKHRSA